MRPIDVGGEEYRYEGDHGAYDHPDDICRPGDGYDERPPAPPLSPRERELVDRFEAAPDPFAGEKCDCIAVDQGLIIDCTLTLGHAGSCDPGSIDWSRAPGGFA